jgi:hemerythrin-like metal-binding protein
VKQLEWKFSYSLGNALIDAEHQTLLALVNKITSGGFFHPRQQKLAFFTLIQLFQDHCEHEEDFMHRVKWPEAEEHANIHRKFLDELSLDIKGVSDFQNNVIIEKIHAWIDQHILAEDVKLKQYLIDHNRYFTLQQPIPPLQNTQDNEDKAAIEKKNKEIMRYATGNIQIDMEHYTLLELTREANQKKGRISEGQLHDFLNTILEYVKFHFIHEEKVLRRAGWSALAHHQETHRNIINDISTLYKSKENTVAKHLHLLNYLNRWVLDHISEEDMKFKNYLIQTNGELYL